MWNNETLWFSTKLIIYGSKKITYNKIDPGIKTISFLITGLQKSSTCCIWNSMNRNVFRTSWSTNAQYSHMIACGQFCFQRGKSRALQIEMKTHPTDITDHFYNCQGKWIFFFWWLSINNFYVLWHNIYLLIKSQWVKTKGLHIIEN